MKAISLKGMLGHLAMAATLLLACASALAFEVRDGDFRTIFYAQIPSSVPVVWRYSDNANIYIFDFPGLTQQGLSFNRVMQFTEQQFKEPYPRVLTNEELAKYLEAAGRTQANFAFGHDILVTEFVQFFNYAERDKVQLNAEEIALRDFLVEQGFIRNWRGFYQAMKPNAVILSIPQTQEKRQSESRITPSARYAIMLHEMAHGEFYTNAFYANYVRKFWNETLTDNQRESFRTFLAGYGYSISDDMQANEMQAYLMFTPDSASFSARKLGVSDTELETMRESFRRGHPPTRLPLHATKGEFP